MKEGLKITGVVVLSLTIFAVAIVASSRLFFAAPPRRDIQDMLQCLEENRDTIFTVKEYFANSEYVWLVYPPLDNNRSGVLWIGDGITRPIDDSDAKEAMSLLLRDGYVRIRKWRGLITFTRWQRGGATVGIVYSADGSIPTPGNIYFLSKLEPLYYEGWYYFETNYNESRLPPTQGIDDMRTEFVENREAILAVRNYFTANAHDVLSYPIGFREETSNRGVIYAGTPRNNWEPRAYVRIDCNNVNTALERLLLHGYMSVRKDGNFITFTRWGRGGVGIGAIYSADRSTPNSDVLPYLTKLEPSEEDGWFYYEVNSRNWSR